MVADRSIWLLSAVYLRASTHYQSPNWLLHGLNVLQHALNVALLMALSWRLWRTIASGLLVAVCPFSYQAIAVYSHNVHEFDVARTALLFECAW